jgi:decaprenylphospho-beta-D-erythro-pentofuranosid-2-ulose 2-reductase
MRKVLIVGATSAIAEATARIWALRGDHIFLVARDAKKLNAVASDLRVRGSLRVETYVMDVNDFNAHAIMICAAERALNGLDIVLIAHGSLPNQAFCQQSVEMTMQEISTNALSVIALLTHIGNSLEQQGFGTIAVISSVAGDRGRQSNYVYGCAKAMVTTFVSGLRQRLYKSGVSVVTIKPGFVDSPMTSDFKKGLLWVTPSYIAKNIDISVLKKNDVIYTPFYWRVIMLIIKLIPEFWFKRVNL